MRVKFRPVGHPTRRTENGRFSSLWIVFPNVPSLHIRLIGKGDVAEIDCPVWRDGDPFRKMCLVEEFFKLGIRGKDGIVAGSVSNQCRC